MLEQKVSQVSRVVIFSPNHGNTSFLVSKLTLKTCLRIACGTYSQNHRLVMGK